MVYTDYKYELELVDNLATFRSRARLPSLTSNISMNETNNFQLIINKAVLEHRNKNFATAKTIYLNLIDNYPDSYLPQFLLGSLEIDVENYEVAISNLKQSLILNSENIDTYLNLGYCYSILNRHDEAIKIYEKAINLNFFDIKKSEHYRIISKLARIQIEAGEIQEGVSTYKKILKYNPDNLFIYYILHDLKEHILDKTLKNRIKKIQKDKSINPVQNIYSNFLLSKYERENKDFYLEFNFLRKAHEIIFLNNEDNFSKRNKFYFNKLSNLRDSYDNNFNIDIREKERISIKPIFIVGLPRSGSTLLEKIVLQGDRKLIGGEETLIMHTLFNQIEKDSNFKKNLESIVNSIIIHYERRGLINFNKNLYFTDKSLDNFFCLGWIKKIFPNAKIINIKRNPMANIVSIFRSNFFNSSWTHRIEDICKYFNTYYNLIDLWEKEYKVPIFHLAYENLIENFDDETKKLFDYCGLSWSPEIKTFNKNKKIISKTQSMIQIRDPIYNKIGDEYKQLSKFFDKYLENYEWYQKSKT